MAIARRNSRPLEHEGVRYRWRVRRHGSLGLVVVVAPEQRGRRICAWYSEIYDESFTPQDVRLLIDCARRRGWSPHGPGPDEYIINSSPGWIDVDTADSPGVGFEHAYARAALGLTPPPDLRRLVLHVPHVEAARTDAMPIDRCADQLDAARETLAIGGRATLEAAPGTRKLWLEPDGVHLVFGVDDGERLGLLPRPGVMDSLRDGARRLRTIARRVQAGDPQP